MPSPFPLDSIALGPRPATPMLAGRPRAAGRNSGFPVLGGASGRGISSTVDFFVLRDRVTNSYGLSMIVSETQIKEAHLWVCP